MAIFGSVVKSSSGRTTCTHHPFAEGADPPTPLTATPKEVGANHPYKAPGAVAPEAGDTPPSSQKPAFFSVCGTKVTHAPAKVPCSFTTPPRKVTPVIPMTRTPPSTWSRSMTSTLISALPPTLPPPSYGLPPTPEASPQQGPTSATEGGTRPLKIRKHSTRNLSKPVPAAPSARPPTSRTSPTNSSKHGRTTSSPSPLRSAPSQRFRSASESATAPGIVSDTTPFTIDSEHGMRDRYPAPSPSPRTGQKNSFNPSTNHRPDVTLATHAPIPTLVEPVEKHRPAALKLRTSNLTDNPRIQGPARIEHRRLPIIDYSDGDNVLLRNAQFLPVAPSGTGTRVGKPTPRSCEGEQALGTGFSMMTPDRPTVARLESESTIRATITIKTERRRSMSTGDVLNISQLDKLRNPEDTPRKRREGSTQDTNTLATRHPPRSPTPRSHTPKSASTAQMSRTPASAYTNLPHMESAMPTVSTSTVKPFENLPLPWSTVEASTLAQDLGQQAVESLMDFTLPQLVSLPPRLLHPSILKTSASEEGRLRSELARLKDKYHALIAHRDGLAKRIEQSIVKADQVRVHKMVQALGQVSRKCDRVARQVYICNDQIRQIEIQAEEHVVGALRLALGKKEEQLERLRASLTTSNEQIHERVQTQADEAAECRSRQPATNAVHSPSELGAEAPTPRNPPSGPVVRFLQPAANTLRSPTSPKYREKNMRISMYGSSSDSAARPISTATIININTLSFPLPPSRIRNESHSSTSSSTDWLSSGTSQGSETDTQTGTDTETESVNDDAAQSGAAASYGGLEVQIEPEADGEGTEDPHDLDFESSDSHRTATISILGGNEIVIYPPGHNRSLSAPSCCIGVDLPDTPASWGGHEQYPPSPSTSGGHLDIMVDKEGSLTQSRRHERSVSESDCISPLPSAASGTEPLRLKVPLPLPSRSSSSAWKGNSQSISRQTRSMNVKSGQEGTKRPKVVRESVLETVSPSGSKARDA
ncbi:hypothetical protein I317_07166 [Kwoniella heveanensis CBS 569]|nr:hypothetical protein I317_07166 [Kwoniella heveanensis CBS 569]